LRDVYEKDKVKEEKIKELEEGNASDISYILDKINKFDQSLKEHDVKDIIKHTSV
jgi:hypothetical protein